MLSRTFGGGGAEESGLRRPRLVPYDSSDGGCLCALSAPLLLVGALACFWVFSPGWPHSEAGRWGFGSIGIALAAAGVILVGLGVAMARRHSLLKKSLADLFEGPWEVDRWSPPEARDLLRGAAARPLGTGVFLSMVMIPVTVAVLTGKGGPDDYLVYLFDLIPLAALCLAAYRVGRVFKYRDGWLRYAEIPLASAAPIRLTYRAPETLRSTASSLEVVLRCVVQWKANKRREPEKSVEELTLELQSGKRSPTPRFGSSVVSQELFAERRQLQVSELEAEQALEFTLPEDAPGTTLQGDEVTFYEFEVRAEAKGVDYRAIYLLPIYQV